MMNRIIDVQIAAPSAEPVTGDAVKPYLHIDFTEAGSDALLDMMAASARERLEKYTGVLFDDRQVVATMYIDHEQELPYGPVGTITSVEWWDGEAWEAMVEDTDYTIVGNHFKAIRANIAGQYRVTYTGGYATLPSALKEAVMIEAAYQYENRGDDAAAGMSRRAVLQSQPFRRMSMTV